MRHTVQIMIFLLFTSVWFQSCKEKATKTLKTAPIAFTKEGELSITTAQTDSLIVNLDIEIAETDYEIETGLMYRKGMGNDQGMLFIFPDEQMHSFYMKNTEFPLDIIFIKSNFTIGSIQKNAEPFNENSLPSKVPIQYVLEVNAGLTEKWKLNIGDTVEFLKD